MWQQIDRPFKLAKSILSRLMRGFDPPGDEPWMQPETVERFKQELNRESGYVEYGSGVSMILADKAGIPAVSVESGRFYARVVARKLTGNPNGFTSMWESPVAEECLSAARRKKASDTPKLPLTVLFSELHSR